VQNMVQTVPSIPLI